MTSFSNLNLKPDLINNPDTLTETIKDFEN